MQEQSAHIRESVIPDISVKLLNLCLGPDENGVLMPPTHRTARSLEYRADVTLKEMIAQRLCDKKEALSLAIKKRKIYEITENNPEDLNKSNDFDKLFSLGVVPINLRKHMLYHQCRAG